MTITIPDNVPLYALLQAMSRLGLRLDARQDASGATMRFTHGRPHCARCDCGAHGQVFDDQELLCADHYLEKCRALL